MLSFRVIFLQVLYLVLMVRSQLPVNLPSPPILPGPQMAPPNIVAVGTISNGGSSDGSSDSQPPSNTSTTTSAPSIPNAPLPQLPAPTNGSSGPPLQSTNQTLAVPPSNASLSSSRFNGPPPSPSLPILPVTTSRSSNSSGGVSVEVDDFDTNGTLPNITLVVSNVGNGTKISIKNNNKT
ncbi:hypothetical protein J6590_047439 [Homalodisca vitripennis]|nr:hypothetical protein J6590_047439 [Homalodisca vitripennis]